MFEHTHDDLHEVDQSYSTFLLNRIRENAQWVHENRGSHTALTLKSYNNDTAQQAYERPFVSVSGYAAVLRIPWYCNAGLERIRARIHCRVSNGEIDAEPEGGRLYNFEHAVDVRLRLLRAPTAGSSRSILPFRPGLYGPAEWGVADLTYDLREPSSVRESYSPLVVEIKSAIPVARGYSINGGKDTALGRIDWAPIDAGAKLSKYRAKANQDDFYEDALATGAPRYGANEITATVGTLTPSLFPDYDHTVVRWFDHVTKQTANKDRAMYIWPLSTELADTNQINAIHKYHVPYIQFRSIELWEEYA